MRNREATKQRKLDTRRKVILGGALVDLAARDDMASALLDRLVRNLAREQDQAAFNGWDWRAERGGEDAKVEAEVGEAEAEAGVEVEAQTAEAPGAAQPAETSAPGLSASLRASAERIRALNR